MEKEKRIIMQPQGKVTNINPDEIPDVPANKFLYRYVSKGFILYSLGQRWFGFVFIQRVQKHAYSADCESADFGLP